MTRRYHCAEWHCSGLPGSTSVLWTNRCRCRPACEEHFLRICVTDEGIGTTPEQLERVFDKFYHADTSNTAVGGLGLGIGIGMRIARQIVESHGVTIHVTSIPGVGTRSCFTLPFAPTDPP